MSCSDENSSDIIRNAVILKLDPFMFEAALYTDKMKISDKRFQMTELHALHRGLLYS